MNTNRRKCRRRIRILTSSHKRLKLIHTSTRSTPASELFARTFREELNDLARQHVADHGLLPKALLGARSSILRQKWESLSQDQRDGFITQADMKKRKQGQTGPGNEPTAVERDLEMRMYVAICSFTRDIA